MKARCQHGFRTCMALFVLLSFTLANANANANEGGPIEAFATMRDEVKLAADIYLPEGDGPWPVILMRTPYLKGNMARGVGAVRYTDAGYAFVVQDVRGTGNSEGEYRPFYHDREDGYDSVEWAAAQSWSNGSVGMTGASAMGITANLAATTAPPSLVAAYVRVAPHLRFDEATFIGGVFKAADSGGWLERQGAGDQVADLKQRVLWDEEWEVRETAPNLHNVRIPMYNDGGWYDIFAYGNVRNFMYLQQFGAFGAKQRQKLSMGPYGHGALSGDLAYPGYDNLALSGDEEMRWFDYWLRGVDNSIMDEPAVRYYMMASSRKGAHSDLNGWRTAEHWPPPNRPTRIYLQPDLALSGTPPTADADPIEYKFDPDNPVPTIGGANLTFDRGPMDQRAIGDRDDYLRFQTAPLEAPLAITGHVKVELWVTTDGPDTDFVAKLVDVYADGYEAIVLDAPLRTRYRHGFRAEDVAMMTPGEPTLLVIDLWHTAITFEAGHRIALHVTSSSSPRFEVNDNSGTPPGEPADPRVAVNAVLASESYPSALVLPVMF
jgi:uncharacterized protein